MAARERLYVNASDVARVIGAHAYESADAAFVRLLEHSRTFRDVVQAARAGQSPPAVVISEAALAAGVAASVAARSTAGVDAAVACAVGAVAQQDCDARVQTAALEYARAKKRRRLERLARELDVTVPEEPEPDGAAALKAFLAAQNTDPAAAAAMRAAAAASAEAMAAAAPAVEAEVVKQRGVALEAQALDEYGGVVTARNDRMLYLRTPEYVLGGRIDGWDAAARTVVEVKNRRRMWAAVPEYDIIQLRVYMAMLAQAKPAAGLLLERFPDGSTRETRVEPDPAAWARIHAGLLAVAQRFATMTEASVHDLVLSNYK